jgi:hypothetical protein
VTALSLLKTTITPVITNDETTEIDHFEDLLTQLPELLPATMDPQVQRVITNANEDTEDSSQLQRVPLLDINAAEPLTLSPGSPTDPSYLSLPTNITPRPEPRRSTRGYHPSYSHLNALQHLGASAINVDTGQLCEYR